MAIENIELLRDEAQRLLRLNIEGLEEMMAADGLITKAGDTGEDSQQTFDRTSTPERIEVLRGELTKLETMELVIAVVGTMKAGKSTTINAIVGAEVMPNRNRPMTALPTLIRHTPGQTDPILKFENDEPINALFEKIRQRIVTGEVDDLLKVLSSDGDMKELIDNIRKRHRFLKVYQGSTDIFECLKTLNDLVRLSSDLGVDFPFSEYSNIDQMPVIAVEFFHLREEGEMHGQLTLLDTPGPNEAGQDHLRNMLTEQLKKTSAVLAVFDYTQLKSDADEEVRAEIKRIAQLHKGRLFALVNKFDQKDRNGDGKEAVRALVADKLMDGLLDKKHVFPVSSNWGYLANRASHELAVNNELPKSENAPWVTDFKKAALSSCSEDDIPDIAAIFKNPSILWEKSGFPEPMENVIRAAHKNAALLAIDSAAKKLVECTHDIEKFLGVRRDSLSKSAKELQAQIDSLQKKIKIVEDLEIDTRKKINSTIEILTSKTNETIANAKDNSENAVIKYFKKGKVAEGKEIALAQKESAVNRQPNLREVFLGTRSREKSSESKPHFNPDDDELRFDNERAAIIQLMEIQEAVEKSIDNGKSELSNSINSELSKFRTNFEKDVDTAKKIIFDINTSISNEGFTIRLKFPDTQELNNIFKNKNLSLNEKMDVQTKKEPYSVEKSGVLPWLARKIWGGGSETRYRNVTEYIIKIKDIKQFVFTSVGENFDRYDKATKQEIIQPINTEVDEFFNELKKTIGHVRGDLQQGIRDKQNKEESELNMLREYLERFSKGVPAIETDSESLNQDIKDLIDDGVMA